MVAMVRFGPAGSGKAGSDGANRENRGSDGRGRGCDFHARLPICDEDRAHSVGELGLRCAPEMDELERRVGRREAKIRQQLDEVFFAKVGEDVVELV